MNVFTINDLDCTSKKVYCFFLAGFLASLLNEALCVLFFLCCFYFLFRSDLVNLLKAFLLFVIRTTAMNPVLTCALPNVGSYRYQFLLAFSGGCFVLGTLKCRRKQSRTVISALSLLLLAEIAVSAYLCGSYPMVSILKGFLYVLTFNAILYGVSATSHEINWVCFLKRFFLLLFGISLFTIPFMVLRTKNGHAFQGIFIHPNLFAIYGAVLVALLLTEIAKPTVRYVLVVIPVILYMQYLSESRTGLLSSLLIIGVYFFYSFSGAKKIRYGFMAVCLGGGLLVCFPTIANRFSQRAEEFAYKKAEGNLLYSRRAQIRRFLKKISVNPVWGTGFMAPYEEDVRSYDIRTDAYVEQGNIFMAVTSETGIVGTIVFAVLFLAVYHYGKKEYAHLFATPFIISCGEMVFFSSNSVGLTLFFLQAIYLQRNMDDTECVPQLPVAVP